jgi:hypothetical protein
VSGAEKCVEIRLSFAALFSVGHGAMLSHMGLEERVAHEILNAWTARRVSLSTLQEFP